MKQPIIQSFYSRVKNISAFLAKTIEPSFFTHLIFIQLLKTTKNYKT